MTFLDPAQNALVARNYQGPARIAGPAGTGKTVLALHRMAYQARRSTGPLLYTTLAKNLPPYQRAAFTQMAPPVAARAEFTNLHAWARDLLARRGVPFEMDLDRADTAFARAWSRVRAHGPLAGISSDIRYWREEIDRVIKGRGLGVDDYRQYRRLLRRGRKVALRDGAREQVWELYRQHEAIRADMRCHDANDLITAALDQVRRRPFDRPYAIVVVDEVQDMTVQSLRLVHALTGDAPNALLLVGDGRQRIYAGGRDGPPRQGIGLPRGPASVHRTGRRTHRRGSRALRIDHAAAVLRRHPGARRGVAGGCLRGRTGPRPAGCRWSAVGSGAWGVQ
ncbi:UvrD-helicase domain-containing protein [Nocardia sp. SSK8]|uniref:UvrD-helicase domain-containing protein n=1 Tax=Nocardia sp. SSK8 TaxID=3120154 RepID=UPI0030085DD3